MSRASEPEFEFGARLQGRELTDNEDYPEDKVYRTPDFQVLALWSDARETANEKSADESDAERDAALRLQELEESDDPADKADAARLTKMLGGNEKALAISLLNNIVDPTVRRQFFSLVDDPKMARAVAGLTEMLVNKQEEQDAPQGAVSLLAGLKSEQDASRNWLERLNSDKKQIRDEAAFVVRAFGFDRESSAKLLELLEDPARADDGKGIIQLLKGTDGEPFAGRALLNMSLDKDSSTVADRKTLTAMLAESNSRGQAVDILANLSEKGQIHRMLELMAEPGMQRASERLLSLLSSRGSEFSDHRYAQSVLRMLEKTYEPDISDADRYLALLNDANAAKREIAEAVLRRTHDSEYRHHLLPLLENPKTLPGVVRLLDAESKGNRRERGAWAEVLPNLAGKSAADVRFSKAIVEMLAGDEQSQARAKTIVKELSPNEQRNLITILKSPFASDGEKLMGWLTGDAKQRTAARNLLSMNAPSISLDIAGRDSRPVEVLPHSDLSNVLPLIRNKDTEWRLVAMANNFDTPEKMSRFLRDTKEPKMAEGGLALLKLLESKEPSDNQAAKALLEMMSVNRESTKSGNANITTKISSQFDENTKPDAASTKLLTMLADASTAQTAKAILTQLSDGDSRALLLSLMSSDAQKPIAQRLMKMMADEKDHASERRFAEELLRVAGSADDIAKVFSLVDSPEKTRGEQRLLGLLRDQDPVGINVLRMLTSADPEVRKIGNQQLERLDSTRDFWSTSALMRLSVDPRQLSILQQLRDDRQTRSAAEQLVRNFEGEDGRVRGGSRTLLTMLASGSPGDKADARFVVDLLASKDRREIAQNLLQQTNDPSSIARLSQSLRNPDEKESATKLIELMSKPTGREDDRTVPGAALLDRLSNGSRNPADKAGAEQLFRMLADKKQVALAEGLLSQLDSIDQQQLLLKLISEHASGTERQRKSAEVLTAMVLSGRASDRSALQSLMGMYAPVLSGLDSMSRGSEGSRSEVADKLIAGLGDASTKEEAMTLLNKLGAADIRKYFDATEKNDIKAKGLRVLLAQTNDAKVETADIFLRLALNDKGNNPAAKNLQAFVEMLGKSDTVGVAKKALALNIGRAPDVAVELVSTEAGIKAVEDLSRMIASDGQFAAEAIRNANSTAQLQALVALKKDPGRKAQAETLLRLFADPDNLPEVEAGRAALRLLGSDVPANRKGAESLLKLLAVPGRAGLARMLAVSGVDVDLNAGKLFDVMLDPRYQSAMSVLSELEREDTNDAFAISFELSALLDNVDPKLRREGLRILEKLNDDAEKDTALRLLRASDARFRR